MVIFCSDVVPNEGLMPTCFFEIKMDKRWPSW